MSLDNPDVDGKINEGTTAPNCQPKHTVEEEEKARSALANAIANGHGEGVEVNMTKDGKGPEFHLPDDGSNAPLSQRHRRIPSTAQVQSAAANSSERGGGGDRSNRQDTEAERQAKLTYFQMAKMGYQELVNAFIRPPRAEYKVSALHLLCFNLIAIEKRDWCLESAAVCVSCVAIRMYRHFIFRSPLVFCFFHFS